MSNNEDEESRRAETRRSNESSSGSSNSHRRMTLRRGGRRNGDWKKSAVEYYIENILTQLSGESSTSSESSDDCDDDDDDDCEGAAGGSSQDDWSTEDDEVENAGESSKSVKMKISGGVDAGAMSDSSDGTTEKCPICFGSFHNQEIGVPENCEHVFCFSCIEQWSKNVSNCPIDRKNFTYINMKENIDSKATLKKVQVEAKNFLEENEDVVIEVDLTSCEVCNNTYREDCMLLCDGCNRGYHLFCLTPALLEVPQGSWYCDNCFSSESNNSDNEVEALMDDVRELGEPTTRFRTNVRNIPRITRTRQSERIRAEIIARTRINRRTLDAQQPSTSSGFGSIIDTITRGISQRRTTQRKTRRRKRRATRRVKRSVVEYGIDGENNKFPIETASRIVRRRKRKQKKRCRTTRQTTALSQGPLGESTMTTRRAARDLLSAVPRLHLFGNRDQLDYFPSDNDSDDETTMGGGGADGEGSGTVVHITRSSRVGSRSFLNRQKSIAVRLNATPSSTATSGIDLLSSILETQERWHSTTSNNIKIAEDGRLVLEQQEKTEKKETPKKPESPVISPDDVVQAPIYPRGGGGGNRGGNNSGYNNRGGYYNSNNNNSGGGSGYRRDSGGGSSNNFRGGNNSYNNSSSGGSGGTGGSGGGNYQSPFFGNNNSSFNQSGNNNTSGNNSNQNYSPFRGRGRGNTPQNFQRNNSNNNNSTPNRFNNNNNNNNNINNRSNRSLNNNNFNQSLFHGLPPAEGDDENDEFVLPSAPLAAQQQIPVSPSPLITIPLLPPPPLPVLPFQLDDLNSAESDNIADLSVFQPIPIMESSTTADNAGSQPYDPDVSTADSPILLTNENIVDSASPVCDESANISQSQNSPLRDEIELPEDECPNHSVYSAESMDIVKESENSEQGMQVASSAVPASEAQEEERDEDLVQMDDDDEVEEDPPEKDSPQNDPQENKTPQIEIPQNEPPQNEPPQEGSPSTDKPKAAESKATKNAKSNNKKNILELYDDSDWEEWNVEKPDEEEKIAESEIPLPGEDVPAMALEPASVVSENIPENEDQLTESISEDERSYTPCLDEKQTRFDTTKSASENEEPISEAEEKADDKEKTDDEENDVQVNGVDSEKPSTSGICGLDTEMISDDDEENFIDDQDKDKEPQAANSSVREKGKESRQNGGDKFSKSSKKKGSSNSFKKIGKNTKGRNYRDKDRDRKRKRSRSKSNENKENRLRNRFGRGQKKRDKRKDLERYNVRTIIGERQPRQFKDKYGRDLSRPKSNSRSRSRDRRSISKRRTLSRGRSRSRRKSPFRRRSHSRRRTQSPRRSRSKSRSRRRSPIKPRRRSRSKSIVRSRSPSRGRNAAKQKPPPRKRRTRSKSAVSKSPSRSPSISRSGSFSISRSRSPQPPPQRRTKHQSPVRRAPPPASAKRKVRKRTFNVNRSPTPRPVVAKKKAHVAVEPVRRRSQSWTPPLRKQPTWSRSKSPAPVIPQEEGWTPPPIVAATTTPTENLTVILKNKDAVAAARAKKKEKKRKERKRENLERKKEKRRQQRTEKQPSPAAPSKEVFASGNNILVSVSFNKNQEHPPQQTTVVTLPPSRSQIVSTKQRRNEEAAKKSRKEKNKTVTGRKHKKVDMKPVAIIDLDRSPFKEMTPSPKAVIILSDSDNETVDKEKKKTTENQDIQVNSLEEISDQQMSVEQASQPQSPIVEDSFDMQLMGPKTPPEPSTGKFTMAVKKSSKLRPINPLHDLNEADEQLEDEELNAASKDQNKIGPNTPPEPAPTSPDAYDPFEPTKSPSQSPSPARPDMADLSTNDGDVSDNVVESTQDVDDQTKRPQLPQPEKILNPVDLVMALMNKSTASAHADISSTSGDNFNLTSNEIQNDSSVIQSTPPTEKSDEQSGSLQQQQQQQQKSITVLSNVLIANVPNNASSGIPQQRGTNSLLLPNITSSNRSPAKPQFSNATSTTKPSPQKSYSTVKQNLKAVAAAAAAQLPKVASNNRFDISIESSEFESPYSPGSSDYDDLFEPPMESSTPPQNSQRHVKGKGGGAANNQNKNPAEVFDNLFGSASPVQGKRNYMKGRKKYTKKTIKDVASLAVYSKGSQLTMGKLDEDQLKILDDLPSSAVELQVKDKFLRKLNRQERVVEEVKHVLKPHYVKKHVTKEEYKDILRRAVPKICHNRTGEINPTKINALIEAYVRKFRYKRKKFHNSVVSSSNKLGKQQIM